MVRTRWGTDNFQEARELFQRAIEIDPGFARAHAGLCWVNTNEQFQEGTGGLDLNENIRLAQRAIELDPKDAFAHLTLGIVYASDQQFTEGIKAYEESLRINPSYAHAHSWLSGALSRTGRPKEGISHARMAMRLSPADPSIELMYQRMAMAHHCLGDYEQVVEWAGKAISKNAPWPNHALLTSALAHLGRASEAKRAKNELLKARPNITIEYVNQRLHRRPTIRQSFR
jgi:tetratricopeptide (TPR) repeat protein